MKTWQLVMISLLAGLFLAAAVLLASGRPRGASVILKPVPTLEPLHVDIGGAVKHPGTYTLPPGSRIANALDAAGGLLPEADSTNLNLAATLNDGDMLRIPVINSRSESTAAPETGEIAPPRGAIDLHLNLNTATMDELIQLPGIGETRAMAILEYRHNHQRFISVEEIQEVAGIGEDTYLRIKEYIYVK